MPRPFAVIGYSVFFTLALLLRFSARAALVVFALAAALFLLCYLLKKLRITVLLTALLSVMAACALFLTAVVWRYEPARALEGRTVSFEGQLLSLPEMRYGKAYYTVRTNSVDGLPLRTDIRLALKEGLDARPTDFVSGEVTLYALGEQDADRLRYYKADGVFLGAYTRDELRVRENPKPSLRRWVQDLREYLLDGIDARLPNENGGLVKALLLGDTTGLSAKTGERFSDLGVSHIVSVSGMHFSIWALFLFRICEFLRMKRRLSAALSCGFILLFMALSGFTDSVTRSGVMMLLMMLGHIVSREADSLNSLGFAVLLIGVLNPFAPGGAGLQLSFAATLGILLLAKRLESPLSARIDQMRLPLPVLRRPLQSLLSMISTTLAATLFSLPLIILFFGRIPLLALPANLLIVSPASLCMLTGGFAAMLSGIGPLAGLSKLLAMVSGLYARDIYWTAEKLTAFPYATLRANTGPMLLWLAGSLLLAGAALWMYWRSGKKLVRLTALLCTALFFGTIVIQYAFSAGSLQLTAVDVGNGTALILSQGRKALLIDSGGTDFFSEYNIGRALSWLQVNDLRAVFLPRNTKADNEAAASLILDYRPLDLYTQRAAAPLDLLLPPEQITTAESASFFLGDAAELSYLSNETLSCAYLRAGGVSGLLLFYPGSDVELIPAAWRSADFLFCRGAPPEALDCGAFRFVIISAEGEKGLLEQEDLLAAGVQAAATASQGDIVLTLDGGKLSARRKNWK